MTMELPDRMDEQLRALGLVEAQRKAVRLFAEVETRGLVAPGAGEREVSDRIRDLANELFGTTKHWILEIDLVDERQGFGGFYEQLLDLA